MSSTIEIQQPRTARTVFAELKEDKHFAQWLLDVEDMSDGLFWVTVTYFDSTDLSAFERHGFDFVGITPEADEETGEPVLRVSLEDSTA